MSRNGTLITLILSLLVIGASIWVGSLLLQNQSDKGVLIATGPDLINNLPAPPVELSNDAPGGTTIVIDEPQSLSPPALEEHTQESSPLEVIPPPATPAPVKPQPSNPNISSNSGNSYWVQAGSFSTLARATAAADALQGLGLNGSIETVMQNERVLYRLRFGTWQNLAEAQRFRDYLRDQENLRNAFQARQMHDRSGDFVDAFVVQ